MNDVINREDAIDAVLGIGHTAKLNDGDTVVRMSAVNYVLRNLPSAQPEIKTDGDTISRQAAIEAVYKNDHYTTIKQRLDDLPSAQPEIIRCKNCKHRHLDGMIWNCPFGLSGGEDFFCAYGAKDGDSDDE